MVRSELRARLLDGLNDPDGAFVTAAQANASLDEAMEVLAEESGLVRRTAHLALQSGTRLYWTRALGPDVMSPYRVWSLPDEMRLPAVSMRELDRAYETWATVQKRPEVWYPVSWDLFGIWPSPATGSGVLRVDYLAWPRALMDDDDEPEALLGDQDALIDYGVYDGLLKRWDVMAALDVFSRFAKRAGISRDRTGAGRIQARAFRLEAADEANGENGVRR